jgi:hypothetical protein
VPHASGICRVHVTSYTERLDSAWQSNAKQIPMANAERCLHSAYYGYFNVVGCYIRETGRQLSVGVEHHMNNLKQGLLEKSRLVSMLMKKRTAYGERITRLYKLKRTCRKDNKLLIWCVLQAHSVN